MTYTMHYVDHRERVAVIEFCADGDAAAVKTARHHLAEIKATFRRDHPRARVRAGWYVLWIVTNVDTGALVYNRREALRAP